MRRRDVLAGLGAMCLTGYARAETPVRRVIIHDARTPGHRLVYSGAGLARLGAKAIEFLDTSTGRPTAQVRITQGLGMGTLQDGTLVALEAGELHAVAVRVTAARHVSRHLTRHALLGTPLRVLGDPARPDAFWVLDGKGSRAVSYVMKEVGGALEVEHDVPLGDLGMRDAAALGDGGILLVNRGGLCHLDERGLRSLAWDADGEPAMVAGSASPRRAWVLTDLGTLILQDLDRGEAVVEMGLGGEPVALGADADGAYAVTAEPDRGTWFLQAVDAAGAPRWSVEGDGWPGESTCVTPAWIALGDDARVRIWSRNVGRLLASQP